MIFLLKNYTFWSDAFVLIFSKNKSLQSNETKYFKKSSSYYVLRKVGGQHTLIFSFLGFQKQSHKIKIIKILMIGADEGSLTTAGRKGVHNIVISKTCATEVIPKFLILNFQKQLRFHIF